ncbi:MAG: DUF4149 domain-containing protein [Acidobacteriota bacterium]|nr:DUF4149 domain-containing protein [Acidobacteriota bacterium]
MTFLRFVKVLVLGLWLGSIFFFGAVVAPGAFAVLPSHYLAGLLVSRSLLFLHWMGTAYGLIFLLSAFVIAFVEGGRNPFHGSNFLALLMIVLTLGSHYTVEKKMLALRDSMGVIDTVAKDDPRRVEFNHLHKYSTGLEGAVFVVGLALLYFTVKHENEERY